MEKVRAGILLVLSAGCTWRAIAEPDASWHSICQDDRCWCREGVWEAVWQTLCPTAPPGTVYLDATHIKVPRRGLNPAGGRETQALGLTKGGWHPKVPAAVDRQGVPHALFLSAGNVADLYQATDVLEELKNLPATMVVADKGCDADDLRGWLYEPGITPCLPPNSNRLDPLPYRKASYRKRPRVENFFAHLKTFRRVATRYAKLAETFLDGFS